MQFGERPDQQKVDHWEVGESVPLAIEVLHRANENDGTQVTELQVRRSKRHHEIHETQTRRALVGQNAHDDMPLEVRLSRLSTVLDTVQDITVQVACVFTNFSESSYVNNFIFKCEIL